MNPLFMTVSGEDIRREHIRCDLCPNHCEIKNASFGSCGVRGNKSGKGIIPFYGFISALAVDPIEKKPLYHFMPRTSILSLGFAGCNLRCPFCQNWHISQSTDVCEQGRGKWMQPGEIISSALKHTSGYASQSGSVLQPLPIAYTYSEPLVHIEYILECMALARQHGIANVLVTNGCVNKEPAETIIKLTDAANVDLKCFSAETYKKILGAGASCGTSAGDLLQAVLDFIKLCYQMGVHLEITTLVVPGLNDSQEELDAIADFIAGLDKEIPWHLSAYRPEYRWNAPRTDPGFLRNAAKKAGRKLRHVHTGNI